MRGPRGRWEEDGIHLQYNVEQKVTVDEKGRL